MDGDTTRAWRAETDSPSAVTFTMFSRWMSAVAFSRGTRILSFRRSLRWTSAARDQVRGCSAGDRAERAHAAGDDDHPAGRERAAGDPRGEITK